MCLSWKRDTRPDSLPHLFPLAAFHPANSTLWPSAVLPSKSMHIHILEKKQTETVTHRWVRKSVSSWNGAWNVTDGQRIGWTNVIWRKEGERERERRWGERNFETFQKFRIDQGLRVLLWRWHFRHWLRNPPKVSDETVLAEVISETHSQILSLICLLKKVKSLSFQCYSPNYYLWPS